MKRTTPSYGAEKTRQEWIYDFIKSSQNEVDPLFYRQILNSPPLEEKRPSSLFKFLFVSYIILGFFLFLLSLFVSNERQYNNKRQSRDIKIVRPSHQ